MNGFSPTPPITRAERRNYHVGGDRTELVDGKLLMRYSEGSLRWYAMRTKCQYTSISSRFANLAESAESRAPSLTPMHRFMLSRNGSGYSRKHDCDMSSQSSPV